MITGKSGYVRKILSCFFPMRKLKTNMKVSLTNGENLTFLIKVLFSFLIMTMGINLASSMSMPIPDTYSWGECEVVAHDFQESYGGDMVFIQPLQENGGYDFDDYNGHWINRVYVWGNKQLFFIDYYNQRIFRTKEEVKEWYLYQTGHKSEVYVIGEDNVPFGIHYHY